MVVRTCLLTCLLALVGGLAQAQSVEATAVGQSLQRDLQEACRLLQANRSPWQNPAACPQPEPLALLRAELPGNHIWRAFRPVDLYVRDAYRLQMQGFIAKDPAVPDRRRAKSLLDDLAAAIRLERDCYNNRVISLATRQVAEVDYALEHMEYYSALCVLWSMADMLGLWDRQAALEVAEDHLGELRRRGSGRAEIKPRDAQKMTRELEVIAAMVVAALTWQPLPEGIGPAGTLHDPQRAADYRHYADPVLLGGAFDVWRDTSSIDASASPVVHTHQAATWLTRPAKESRCLYPLPCRYRDWQYVLDDYRYGWIVDTRTAGGQWAVGCDWRRLKPWAARPGAKGAENAGGL